MGLSVEELVRSIVDFLIACGRQIACNVVGIQQNTLIEGIAEFTAQNRCQHFYCAIHIFTIAGDHPAASAAGGIVAGTLDTVYGRKICNTPLFGLILWHP